MHVSVFSRYSLGTTHTKFTTDQHVVRVYIGTLSIDNEIGRRRRTEVKFPPPPPAELSEHVRCCQMVVQPSSTTESRQVFLSGEKVSKLPNFFYANNYPFSPSDVIQIQSDYLRSSTSLLFSS